MHISFFVGLHLSNIFVIKLVLYINGVILFYGILLYTKEIAEALWSVYITEQMAVITLMINNHLLAIMRMPRFGNILYSHMEIAEDIHSRIRIVPLQLVH